MNRIIVFITVCLFIHNIAFTQTPTTHNDPHWQLKWEDNFNSFDNSKWVKMNYGYHGEPQLYLESQVWTSNGNLVIELNNTKAKCPNPAPDPTRWSCGKCASNTWYDYSSGWVETTGEYNTQYGYVEARI